VALLAERFADGVWFVALAAVSDPALVVPTIAQALGVKEEGSQPLVEQLKHALGAKLLLLVLDNFEQIVDAGPQVAQVLASAPRVKVLVTSREVLHLSGEHEVAVPPLSLPPRAVRAFERSNVQTFNKGITQYEAVRLFIARAQAVKADFAVTNENAPAVAEICHRLDGLPLALVLAAARVKLLAPHALLARLDQRLKLLTGGARDLPARQQTIRNTIDWSYHLLERGEQMLFRRLGVFVGGCTLEAVEAVCNVAGDLPLDVLDGLAALVDKSLLQQAEGADGAPRFTMLETIREYALDRLAESGERDALRRQHLGYYLALAEQAAPEWDGAQQHAWIDRLRQDYGNLRASLGWTIEQDTVELGHRLVCALERFWFRSGSFSEGRRWTAALLARAHESWPDEIRARVLRFAGSMAWHQGDYTAARGPLEESASIYRRLGDKPNLGPTLNLLGLALLFQSQQAQACLILEESIALSQEIGDLDTLASSFLGRAYVAMDQADYLAAHAFLEQSLPIYQTLGIQWGIAQALNDLGDVARCERDYARAAALYQESLTLFQAQGIQIEIAAVLHNLGYVALAMGDQQRAHACFAESLALHREQGNQPGILECLAGFGALLAAQGQPKRAAVLFGAIAALRAILGAPMWPAERVEYERHLAGIRAALGEGALQAALGEGHALSLEQAIAEALNVAA